MSRTARVPQQLLTAPFTLEEALEAGLSQSALRSRAWRRIARGLYVHSSLPDLPELILPGCLRLLPPGAVFSGRTAAALHGLALPYRDPIEVTVPLSDYASHSRFFNLSRAALDRSEIVVASPIPVTTVPRTFADLAGGLSLTEMVVHLDHALGRDLVDGHQLRMAVANRKGRRGVERLRRGVELADGRSESPMESRIRVRIVTAGLPKPELQVDLHDAQGHFVARADLYYPDVRLVIEYDGENHRDRLVEDDRRQNRILAAGYGLLRFTAADMRGDPADIPAQVRQARTALVRRSA